MDSKDGVESSSVFGFGILERIPFIWSSGPLWQVTSLFGRTTSGLLQAPARFDVSFSSTELHPD